MEITLRPHHIACLRSYIGRGYDESFVKNADAIADMLNSDPQTSVRITLSRDSLCGSCPNMNAVCRDEQKAARYDREWLFELGIEERAYPYEELRRAALLKKDAVSRICNDCEWYELCK